MHRSNRERAGGVGSNIQGRLTVLRGQRKNGRMDKRVYGAGCSAPFFFYADALGSANFYRVHGEILIRHAHVAA